MERSEYAFTLDFQVRDYECDFQGIVNNAIYQHYLEHTRNSFLKAMGMDVVAMSHRKINMVVTRVELNYRHPLTSGDCFWVGVNLRRFSRLRIAFHQDIFRSSDNLRILDGGVIGAAVGEHGRPVRVPEFERLLIE